ncbi:hypothetical protein AU375_03607 [Methylobacterium radiotolerans]|nr:hypothetical protein AU375_03607 [Methylobacterium radiotolerans]
MPRRILPLVPDGLTVVGIEPSTDPLIVRVVTRPDPTCCPTGRSSAGRKRGRCERTLADLPWQGRSVRLRLRLRRFRCANPACPRRTFSQSVGDVAVAHARRSERLRVFPRHRGLALGGAPAARMAHRLAMPVSGDSHVRLVHAAPMPTQPKPCIVGIYGWAWGRGRSYSRVHPV